MTESIKRNKKINALQEAAIQYYIAQDSLSNYFTSPNGFWYKFNNRIDEGNKTPIAGDRVEFEYEISDLNNNILYSMNQFR